MKSVADKWNKRKLNRIWGPLKFAFVNNLHSVLLLFCFGLVAPTQQSFLFVLKILNIFSGWKRKKDLNEQSNESQNKNQYQIHNFFSARTCIFLCNVLHNVYRAHFINEFKFNANRSANVELAWIKLPKRVFAVGINISSIERILSELFLSFLPMRMCINTK